MPSEWGPAKRIAVLLHDFSGGGSERVAIRLANGWVAAGRSVTILCGTEAGPLRSLVADGVVVRAVVPVIPRRRGSRRRLGQAMATMVRDAGFDILVGPGNFHAPVLRALADRLGKATPAMVCKISNPVGRADQTRLRRRWAAWKFRRATWRCDALVAMSPLLADAAARALGRAIDSCPEPSIDDGWIAPARTGGGRTILCAGRLVAQKRFALALEAFARLDPCWRLTILGDGEERAMLERRAAVLGVAARVAFAGHVAAIGPWLEGADAFLSTSVYEGYPAVLVEAVAAGVPVVTTDCSPALAEILPGTGLGRIVAADAERLAEALRAVLAAGATDGAARAALIERHRLAAAAAAWLAVLDRVVATRSAG